MPYPVSARSYLARARQRLMERKGESLFYASFELRCCVEARQYEYAAALEFIRSKTKPWKIGKTAALLESIHQSGKIACITYRAGKFAPHTLYYTPVSKPLYEQAEKLGSLLHCMKAFKSDDELFWSETRARLEEIYRAAWYSCQGKLLTPPLFDHPIKVEEAEETLIDLMSWAYKEKVPVSMEVEYLTSPPAIWVCDV